MTKFIHIGSSKIKLGFQDVSPQRVRRKNVWNLTATNGKANRYSHKDQLILTQAQFENCTGEARAHDAHGYHKISSTHVIQLSRIESDTTSDLTDLMQKCNPLRGATRHFCVWHMIFTYIFHTDCQKTNLLMHLMSAWAHSCPLLVGDYVSNARLVLGSLNHHTRQGEKQKL